MTRLLIILLALTACNKSTGPILPMPMGIQDDARVQVVQTKQMTVITVDSILPKPYDRAMTIQTIYSGTRLTHVLRITPTDTVVVKQYSTNTTLTDWWVESFTQWPL